nr:PAS domain S-box protein [Desulfosporosinus hippei]
MQDAFFAVDQDWKFTYTNKEFDKVLTDTDVKYQDILGKCMWDIFPKEIHSLYYSKFNQAMIEKIPVHFEGYSPASKRWYNTNVYSKSDGISVYFRDITDYKIMEETLRESEERFRTAFENAAVGMAIVTIEGRFIRANGPYCKMVGYTDEELHDTKFLRLTHPDDIERNREEVNQLLKGEIPSFHIEKRYIHKQGNMIWVQVNTSLLRDKEGTPQYFIAQAQDITSRITAANEMNQMNSELLEQRIEAERQREEALEANKHKSQFLATMSHELRTPLNSIIGFTNRVLKKCAKVLPRTQFENLEIVRDEAEHLLKLIDSVLDYSKVEAGKMEIYAEEFDLEDVVNQVSVMAKKFVGEKPIKYQLKLPELNSLLIYSDKLKVKQILINLLSNALKYSEEGPVSATRF